MAKNKDPAVLFYTSDFLVGVQGLTMEERGQYITLLCLNHQQGRLKPKDIKLAVGQPSDDVMEKFICDENGLFYNKRMEEESNKRKNYSESRRRNINTRYQKAGNGSHEATYVPTYEATYELHMENENINENININKVITKSFIKPTLEEVRAYCLERNKGVDAEKWYNHYTSNGWRVGRNPMKDWKAAVRTWETNDIGNSQPKEDKPKKLKYGNFDVKEAFNNAIRRSYGDDIAETDLFDEEGN